MDKIRLQKHSLGYEKSELKISWFVMKKILSMGIPSGIENGMFHVGKIILTSFKSKKWLKYEEV